MTASDTDTTAEKPRQRSILEMTCNEARSFLLKQESYCNFDLPPYFVFDDLLTGVSAVLALHKLTDIRKESPRTFEDVNHRILNNKDGRHAWRPFEIIHPAIYVSLVRQITEKEHWETICNRFAEFTKLDRITCLSIPVESLTEEKDKAEQVSHWVEAIEHKSLELALDYDCIIHADITDCYGAIYTHSIAWAVHTKSVAKSNRDLSLIGNKIDNSIQDMRHGQTNGIPQGSVLMDFIAEMVLGYADLELAKKVDEEKVTDYLILRYRDDYRIFVNNHQDGERILKCLTEVLIGLGLKLNAAKTKYSNLVINESIKPDKLAWMSRKQYDRNLQKQLLIIHNHSIAFPNAGSLKVALSNYNRRISRQNKWHRPLLLISIVVDIAYRNPGTYPICIAILSKLLSFLESTEIKSSIVEKIAKKFSQIPNTGHMDIWLQRISYPFAPNINFEEPLCKLVQHDNVSIWNNDWISLPKLKTALGPELIIDRKMLDTLDPVIPPKEIELFISRSAHSL